MHIHTYNIQYIHIYIYGIGIVCIHICVYAYFVCLRGYVYVYLHVTVWLRKVKDGWPEATPSLIGKSIDVHYSRTFQCQVWLLEDKLFEWRNASSKSLQFWKPNSLIHSMFTCKMQHKNNMSCLEVLNTESPGI